MADFTVIVASGATILNWLDPASAGGVPSRLNSKPGYPQKRWVGSVGVQVVLKAVVNGVIGPADATLGGRLFVAWPVEAPAMPFSGIRADPGFTSVQRVQPDQVGHYTIGIRRPDGGLEHVHLDVG